MKKILIFIILFYFLALLQTSFLVHFNILLGWGGYFPTLIIVILINLFESPQENSGWISAICGGFFLDIFSGAFDTPLNFIGYWILILGIVAFFIKFIFRKYVQIPIWRNI